MNFIDILFHIVGAYLTRMLVLDVEKLVRLSVAVLKVYLPLVAVGGTLSFLMGRDAEVAITSWYAKKLMAAYTIFYETEEKSMVYRS